MALTAVFIGRLVAKLGKMSTAHFVCTRGPGDHGVRLQRPFSWLKSFGNCLIQHLPFLPGSPSFIRMENEKSWFLMNLRGRTFLTTLKMEALDEG